MADISKIKTLDGTTYDIKDYRTKYKVSLTAEVSIPANSDLNSTTYLKTGSYANPLTVNTSTIANIPSGLNEAFMLNVYNVLSGNSNAETVSGNWLYRLQEITAYTGKGKWVRLCSSNGEGVWGYQPWTKVWPGETYTSKAAASGGTAVSLCTTGEKYIWNDKYTKAEIDDMIGDVESILIELRNAGS